jgi:hypothetical protein
MITNFDTQIIIDIYIVILNKYFDEFIKLEIYNYEHNKCCFGEQNIVINYNNISNSYLFIGISIIHRIFEFIFKKTKNINTIYYYLNETISYYLEYIIQIYKSNLFYNLNQSDTVLFVYKKIIFELFDYNNEDYIYFVEIVSKSILSNIIHVNKNNYSLSNITNEEFDNLFVFIKKTTHLLLSWKHTFSKKENDIFNENSSYLLRIEFCQHFLESFLKKQNIFIIIEYLELLYSRIDITLFVWKQLLENILLESVKKNKKMKFENIETFLFQFIIHKDIIKEKLENNETKIIVKWLLFGDFLNN